MPKTIVSPLVYSEDEYNIAALLSSSVIQKVSALQNQFKELLGDAIWLTPVNCLHITLMEIICDAKYKVFSRENHFKNWYVKHNEQTREIIAGFPPLSTTFNEVRVSQGAIIIKAFNSSPFNEIRDKLLARIELPQGTKTPPDITHCTIARFNQSVDLGDIHLQTKGLKIDLTERITTFSLVKDLVPPDFRPQIIEIFGLSGKATSTIPPV